MNPVFPILAVAGIVLYLLYRRGLAVTKAIIAVLFVFRPGREEDRVSLNSCTGWVRHAGRFRGGRNYEFTLDCQISEGSVAVSLLDRSKQTILKLDQWSLVDKVKLEERGRYYLHWGFDSATGQCKLSWKEIETTGEELI